MSTALTYSQIYARDQDDALDFQVGNRGLEVNTDARLGAGWPSVFPAALSRAFFGSCLFGTSTPKADNSRAATP
ncbi:hypothetical protein [Streptomyces umbrinus]|uniref:hypothetical protein n=1 Tax=Streptomyces umbrinus TaxID=67370 RepID=UPI0033D89888